VLKYLDQSGVSLCLPPAYSWTKKGRANCREVRTRWGKQGRINLIGTLSLDEEVESLQYRMLEEPCWTGEVLTYLDSLAEEAERKGRRVVVVLDNAPFHKAGAIQDARAGWEAKGLELYYLPAYCPHLNLIEGVWRRLKGFLMPRRYYDSLAELKQAVLSALRLLGAVELQC
jgi:putative transposase